MSFPPMNNEQEDALRKLAEKSDDGPWKFKEKHVDSDPDAHVRRAGGEYEDEELDDGGEVVTDWCNNLEYIAAVSPDVILSLLDELSALRADLPEAVKVSEPLTEEKLRIITNPPPKTIPWISGKVGMSMAAELLALRAENYEACEIIEELQDNAIFGSTNSFNRANEWLERNATSSPAQPEGQDQ